MSASTTNQHDSSSTSSTTKLLLQQAVAGTVLLQALWHIGRAAYEIRMYAVREFGRVIHEFDPYFNYRATEVRII